MNALAKKLRAVPNPGSDPVLEAQVAVTKAAEATTAARLAMTAARLTEQTARTRFDTGDASVSVQDLAHARELRESAERKHTAREDAEQVARITLAGAERERAKGEYESKLSHAVAWRSRMGSVLARLASLDTELGKVVEEVADLVADATVAHEEAEALEAVVRPLLTIATKRIEAPSIEDARHMARIHIARLRTKAGRDGLADGFLDGLEQPDWKDTNREAYNAANAALDALEKA